MFEKFPTEKNCKFANSTFFMGLNVNITDKNYKRLILKVGLKGMSYAIFDSLTSKIIHVEAIAFKNHVSTEEELKLAFETNLALTENYDEVTVIHDNNLSTFVPIALFEEELLGSYLQYNTKVFETDLFAFDELPQHQMNTVYVPYVNINNFLLDQFATFDYKHSSTILVSKFLELSKNNEQKQMFVYFSEGRFEIVVVQNQKLLLYNSFDYLTSTDFIYYLLFTAEQLQLNPEIFPLHLLGEITDQDENFKIAYKYVRNTVLHTQFNTDFSLETVRTHFILFNS